MMHNLMFTTKQTSTIFRTSPCTQIIPCQKVVIHQGNLNSMGLFGCTQIHPNPRGLGGIKMELDWGRFVYSQTKPMGDLNVPSRWSIHWGKTSQTHHHIPRLNQVLAFGFMIPNYRVTLLNESDTCTRLANHD